MSLSSSHFPVDTRGMCFGHRRRQSAMRPPANSQHHLALPVDVDGLRVDVQSGG